MVLHISSVLDWHLCIIFACLWSPLQTKHSTVRPPPLKNNYEYARGISNVKWEQKSRNSSVTVRQSMTMTVTARNYHEYRLQTLVMAASCSNTAITTWHPKFNTPVLILRVMDWPLASHTAVASEIVVGTLANKLFFKLIIIYMARTYY